MQTNEQMLMQITMQKEITFHIFIKTLFDSAFYLAN